MIRKIVIGCFTAALIFSGCATNSGPEYDGTTYKQMKTSITGLVIKKQDVVISDTGKGQSTGAIIGSVAGSAAGYNSNNFLLSVGGAIVGGLVGAGVGSEVGKSDGYELTVELDEGRNIIIIIKQDDIEPGDRIEIIKYGSKVESVNKIN